MVYVPQALLFAERNKMAGLKRLLEAGGATVYTSGNKYVYTTTAAALHMHIIFMTVEGYQLKN